MPNSDVAEYEKALSAWERMLAFEMDNLQRSNILRRIADSCLCIIKGRPDEKMCRHAIEAYEEALLSYDADRYPAIHARILRGLGYAYSALSDLSVRQSNLRRAISCWEEALCFFSSQEYPSDHACLQNELGGAYRKLAELERRRENGKKAVEACMAALRLYDRREMPLDFAAAKANLAGAYLILAQAAGYAADQAEGCKNAILSYQEAISVYSKDKYPQEYGAMISNLAIAYLTLSQVEEKEKNSQRALYACREAENYLSREEQPLAYAALENNLGNAYIALAEEVEMKEDAENAGTASQRGKATPGAKERSGGKGSLGPDSEANDGETRDYEYEFLELCQLALHAYSQAAGIYSKEENPWLYATAQNNLASVYLALAPREEPLGNSMKAVRAATEALSFFSFENSPQDYAEAQTSLWMAHLILADIEYPLENCSAAMEAAIERLKAIKEFGQPLQLAGCYKDLAITACMLAEVALSDDAREQECDRAIDAALEALRIYRVQSNPAEYAETQTLLWAAYSALAEVRDSLENCKRSIHAAQAAIRVYEKTSPAESAYAQKNLAHSFITLAGIENRPENCHNAIDACRSALEYYTAEMQPLEHADVLRSLAYAYVILSEAEETEECLKRALKGYKGALSIYQSKEAEMGRQGDPMAHELRERAEGCRRSLQQCKARLKAGRKAGQWRQEREGGR